MATQCLKLCLAGPCALAGEGLEDGKELRYRCFKTTLVLAQGRSLPRVSQVLPQEGCSQQSQTAQTPTPTAALVVAARECTSQGRALYSERRHPG